KGLYKSIGGDGGVFAKLGLDPERLKNLPLVEQFAQIADKLAGVREGADRGALALEILGKSGLALLPLMKDGSEGLRQLTADAARVGAVLAPEQAAELERVGDLIARAWTAGKFAVMSVASAILPSEKAFERISDAVVDGAAAVRQFVEENKDLV